ncbi:dihydroorotate dehydrogenase electron transfer subunit [uncultured Jatrophihabitans sp.]|uniref:iron-sulfur cluster-binding protein n=1 Tax=uncultured Jatrophihabitans sp. TaxID=1610747 RepID=UPI0035CB1441
MTDGGHGPVIETAEVFGAHRAGDLVSLTLIAPEIAEHARPGQFVAARVGDESSAEVLRRALFIAAATTGGAHAGTVTVVIAPRRAGSRWLAGRTAGDRLDLVGPLGTPFPLPSGPSPAVLVAHGYGGGPLSWLAQTLVAQGSPVEVVLGADTASELYGEQPAKRIAERVTVLTTDGSAGRTGPTTDAVSDAIVRLGAEVVYASGPAAVLRRVGELAQEHAIRAQVAVEAPMACGIGVCLSCLLPARVGDGGFRLVRACVEGPVLEAGRVRWGEFA